ncbi:VOC family protein [Martelella sp. HB161492]|uniref:VOC family protein n=1 Tax=Martelella sp. HB161492 TaxID=2720726 RepID=UPI0015909C5E|nr:VOC family protein [Martelella sp. HB161492]
MFNHIMVGSNDIDRSKQFYDAVLAVLGVDAARENVAESGHIRLFYQQGGSTFCVGQPINDALATAGNGSTFAFKCSSAEQVMLFHDVAVAHGGTSIEDPPGLRNSGMGRVYLSYVRDPDGNKLCAIHRPE